jgi:metal-responsive CopG/Arc/MetJ family transcriptional regulator
MRTRTNLIIEESLLTRIDALAGDKNKRAAVIEQALREYVEREEAKAPPVNLEVEATNGKPVKR